MTGSTYMGWQRIGHDSYMTRVALPNGNGLILTWYGADSTRGTELVVSTADENMLDVAAHLCAVTPNGVLVYPNSGIEGELMISGSTITEPEVPHD